MTSLREHLEAIRDRHSPEPGDTWCRLCAGPYRGVPHPCPDHGHAVAALAILDDARRAKYAPRHRLVPDPEETA